MSAAIDYPRIPANSLLRLLVLSERRAELKLLADMRVILPEQVDEYNVATNEIRAEIWRALGKLGYDPGHYQIDILTGRVSRKSTYGIGGRLKRL